MHVVPAEYIMVITMTKMCHMSASSSVTNMSAQSGLVEIFGHFKVNDYNNVFMPKSGGGGGG